MTRASAGLLAAGPFLHWRRRRCRLMSTVGRRVGRFLGRCHGCGGDHHGSHNCGGCHGSASRRGRARSTSCCGGASPCADRLGGRRRWLSHTGHGGVDTSARGTALRGLLREYFGALLGRLAARRRAGAGARQLGEAMKGLGVHGVELLGRGEHRPRTAGGLGDGRVCGVQRVAGPAMAPQPEAQLKPVSSFTSTSRREQTP